MPNSAAIIKSYQQWVESNLTSFVVSHDGGTPLGAGYYDNAASIPTYANLAAVFDAAGVPDQEDWRRQINDVAQAAGQAQENDDYCLELFEDLQKVLNVLVFTKENISWYVDPPPTDNWGRGDGTGATAALAQADAEADWHSTEIPVDGPWALAYWDGAGASWSAILERISWYARASSPDHCTRDVDWYVMGAEPDGVGTWVANDDWPVGYTLGNFALLVTDAGVTGTTIISSVPLGPLPIGAGDNPAWGALVDTTYGWYTSTNTAVLRWNVASGFSYQA